MYQLLVSNLALLLQYRLMFTINHLPNPLLNNTQPCDQVCLRHYYNIKSIWYLLDVFSRSNKAKKKPNKRIKTM